MSKHVKYALALFAALTIGHPALAQPARDCAPGRKLEAAAETRALLSAAGDAMDRQQAALEAGMRDATARAQWSEQERAGFMRTLLQSAPNARFEQQITALTGELRNMLHAAQRGEIKGPEADCRYVAQLRERVGRLRSVLERQTVYLGAQLRKVTSAPRP